MWHKSNDAPHFFGRTIFEVVQSNVQYVGDQGLPNLGRLHKRAEVMQAEGCAANLCGLEAAAILRVHVDKQTMMLSLTLR